MVYKISEVAQKLGMTAHTLRFYDKEGLLSEVERNNSGVRIFTDADIEWLLIVNCLKETGLSLKEIKQYLNWCKEGNKSLQKRLDLFKQQKVALEHQLNQIQQNMEKINYKIAYYEEAVRNGSIDEAKKNKCLQEEKKRVFRI